MFPLRMNACAYVCEVSCVSLELGIDNERNKHERCPLTVNRISFRMT